MNERNVVGLWVGFTRVHQNGRGVHWNVKETEVMRSLDSEICTIKTTPRSLYLPACDGPTTVFTAQM